MKIVHYILALSILSIMASCSATKGLEPNEKLYTGTSIKYKDYENFNSRNAINEAITLSLPKENTPGFLNIKAGFYNLYDSTGNSGFKHTIKTRLGSRPVIFNQQILESTNARLKKIYQDYGYFEAQVMCDSTAKNRRVHIDCEVTLEQRYTVDSITYLQEDTELAKNIGTIYKPKLINKDEFYLQSNLVAERAALVQTCNNNGYAFVELNDVYFYVDTTAGPYKADIHMRMTAPKDSMKYKRYRVGDIYINPNFDLENQDSISKSEMIDQGEFEILSGYDLLRKETWNDAIYTEEGRFYSEARNSITNDRLSNFGLFKFVNLRVIPGSEDLTLDHYFNLTPYKLKSISAEFELNNRSGNYFGIGGRTTYTHRNIFKGAERLDVTLSGGLETQFAANQSFLNSSEIQLETSITYPKVVLPFGSIKTFRKFVPKTFMSVGFNRERRVQYYTAQSAKARYGFKWNETVDKTHFLTPINLNWIFLSDVTPEFQDDLDNNPRLERSLRTTLIFGMTYDFVYNDNTSINNYNQTYFKGTLESSGGLLDLLTQDNNPTEIFKTPFAQFFRASTDLRKYWGDDEGSFATRLILGAGYAYGNSEDLPYSKQFSIGGANSLRAFRLRSIGPGSFVPAMVSDDNQFIDQVGDIKIEANVEYRFPILEYLKGAVFVDAGNVWLFNGDTRPEGQFQFNRFYNEIAVGTGLGFRFDFTFLVIRFDLAFPLRDINENSQFEWVYNKIDIFDAGWRNENLILNLGIGYPF